MRSRAPSLYGSFRQGSRLLPQHPRPPQRRLPCPHLREDPHHLPPSCLRRSPPLLGCRTSKARRRRPLPQLLTSNLFRNTLASALVWAALTAVGSVKSPLRCLSRSHWQLQLPSSASPLERHASGQPRSEATRRSARSGSASGCPRGTCSTRRPPCRAGRRGGVSSWVGSKTRSCAYQGRAGSGRRPQAVGGFSSAPRLRRSSDSHSYRRQRLRPLRLYRGSRAP